MERRSLDKKKKVSGKTGEMSVSSIDWLIVLLNVNFLISVILFLYLQIRIHFTNENSLHLQIQFGIYCIFQTIRHT